MKLLCAPSAIPIYYLFNNFFRKVQVIFGGYLPTVLRNRANIAWYVADEAVGRVS